MTIRRDYNPFANIDIHLPNAYWQDVRRFSRTGGADEPGKGDPAEIPFNRYIDFWTLAACVGIGQNSFVSLEQGEKHRFITGSVLQGDLQRIELLMLLSIAHTGDPFIVNQPRKIVEIAEGYAAGGFPTILEMLREGHLPAAQNLTRSLLRKLRPDFQPANPDEAAPRSSRMESDAHSS